MSCKARFGGAEIWRDVLVIDRSHLSLSSSMFLAIYIGNTHLTCNKFNLSFSLLHNIVGITFKAQS